jgi:hypothetical protein
MRKPEAALQEPLGRRDSKETFQRPRGEGGGAMDEITLGEEDAWEMDQISVERSP